MYRSLIPSVFLLILTLAPVARAASSLSACQDGEVPADGCEVRAESYLYEEAYNGREDEGANQTGADNATTHTLPEGWFQGKSMSWSSPDLTPANIKEGVSVFGLTGILGLDAVANCPVDGASPLAAKCHAQPGDYVYAQSMGGRAANCSVTNNATSGPCWLAHPDGKALRSEPTTSTCFRSGLQTKDCAVSAGSYWYTTAYGGRSRECVEGTNTLPCWLPVESAVANVANICNEDATNSGYNTASCKTAGTNRYVYSTALGGRGTICSSNEVGYCWVNVASKSLLETDLIASNIRNGKSLFGVTGNYTGIAFSWGSGAHREKSSDPNTDNRMTYTVESALAAASNLAADYNPVPKVATSTDGYNQSSQVETVDRTGWNTTQCGTTGSISTRISNCSTTFSGVGSGATWHGARRGNAGQGSWTLVTRRWNAGHGRAYEVWRDDATGLLWSSHVSTSLNWCKASGNSNSSNAPEDMREDDPSNICDSSLFQSTGANDAISACYVGTGFSTAGTTQEGKTSLVPANAVGSGKVTWRLPTMYDYMLANHHGIRFVLPDIWSSGEEWTATSFANDRSKAWTFDGYTGSRQARDRRFAYAVRCVGR